MAVSALRRAALGIPWGLAKTWGGLGETRLNIPARRILVLGYAAIGDLIFFLPVLEALRARWPQAKITFVANPYPTTRELLPATGLVDEIRLVDWEAAQPPGRRREVNLRLASECYDWAVLTLSAPAHYFQEALAQVAVRAGHERPLEGAWPARLKRGLVTGEYVRRALLNRRAAPPSVGEHALERNLRLLDALGVERPVNTRPMLPVTAEARAKILKLLGVGPLVGVHLGAPGGWYKKMWAPERFGELCARLAESARGRFVLLGGMEERASAAAAKRAFPGLVDLTGELSLLETFAALERCKLVLSNDTGIAKAAMTLGVPTATLWGPSDPREYGIVWEPEKHLDLRASPDCEPRTFMGMTRPGARPRCGHEDCLQALTVDAASAAVRAKYASLLK